MLTYIFKIRRRSVYSKPRKKKIAKKMTIEGKKEEKFKQYKALSKATSRKSKILFVIGKFLF